MFPKRTQGQDAARRLEQGSPLRRMLSMVLWGDAAEATLGRRGERAAASFLRRRGFKVLKRNLRLTTGEIDILCRSADGRAVVIVEVKTRLARPGEDRRPPPEASITAHKRVKLLQLAREVRARREYTGLGVRIDVVAVDWPATGRPSIRYYENAVTGN